MPRSKTRTHQSAWQPSAKKKVKDGVKGSRKQNNPAPSSQNENYFATSHLSASGIFENVARSPEPATEAIVQPKLELGAANDRYEREADRVSQQVVRQIHGPAAPACNPDGNLEGGDTPIQRHFLQRRPIQAEGVLEGGSLDASFEKELNQNRGEGQSLAPNLQASMGSAMGADFSCVKIHTNTQSDRLNRSIQAKAFTTGTDIFFRQDAYQPSTSDGQELIAHELTHVVQQNGTGIRRKPTVQAKPIRVSSAPTGKVQRLIRSEVLQDKELEPIKNPGRSKRYPELLKKMEEYEKVIKEKKVSRDQYNAEITVQTLKVNLNEMIAIAREKMERYPTLEIFIEDAKIEQGALDKIVQDYGFTNNLGLPSDTFQTALQKQRSDNMITLYKAKVKAEQEKLESEIDKVYSIDVNENITQDTNSDEQELDKAKKKEPILIKLLAGLAGGSLMAIEGAARLVYWAIKKGLTTLLGPIHTFLIHIKEKRNGDPEKAREELLKEYSITEYWTTLKNATKIYKGKGLPGFLKFLTVLDKFVEKVRNIGGWLSVLTGAIGILFPPALIISGATGGISVFAGIIKTETGILKGAVELLASAKLKIDSVKKDKVQGVIAEKMVGALFQDIFAVFGAFGANMFTGLESDTGQLSETLFEGNTKGQFEGFTTESKYDLTPTTPEGQPASPSTTPTNQSTYTGTNTGFDLDNLKELRDKIKESWSRVKHPIEYMMELFEERIPAAWEKFKQFFGKIGKFFNKIADFVSAHKIEFWSSLDITGGGALGGAFGGLQQMYQ